MRLLNLDEVKHIQLEIMDDIHSFCVEKELRYSLAGGSLLGAVKHKGYVPYDDDIDIMMPRPDYEMFIDGFVSDKDYVMNLAERDSCRELFSKVCRRNTMSVDRSLGRSTFGVFVDVCPVDGAPADVDEFFILLGKKLALVPKLCAYYKEVPEHKLLWQLKYLGKRIASMYPHDILYLKKDINNFLAKEKFDNSPYAGELLVCRSVNDFYHADIFKHYAKYEFEDREYMGIRDYDTYLKAKYSYLGDYMNLPKLSAAVHDYDMYCNED